MYPRSFSISIRFAPVRSDRCPEVQAMDRQRDPGKSAISDHESSLEQNRTDPTMCCILEGPVLRFSRS
jgi:hypothetical protein